MRSFRRKADARRQIFLSLSGSIEGQLREAYERRYEAGEVSQSEIAKKLGVNRSAVNHRLNGHTNMTTKTMADMVWALGHAITVSIYDPRTTTGINHVVGSSGIPFGSAKPDDTLRRPGAHPEQGAVLSPFPPSPLAT